MSVAGGAGPRVGAGVVSRGWIRAAADEARPGPVAVAVLAVALAAVGGCVGYQGQAGDRPDGARLVEGTLLVDDDRVLGEHATGLQVVAVVVAPAFELYASDPLDPRDARADRGGASFVLPVDVERSFNLVLQVATQATGAPGAFLGALSFDDGRGATTLVPAGQDPAHPDESDVDLGVLRAVAGASPPVDNALAQEAADNPLSQLDTDEDGTVDLQDADDDDDGTPDDGDEDVAGDGVDDGLQKLAALPDDDDDGVPDPFTR